MQADSARRSSFQFEAQFVLREPVGAAQGQQPARLGLRYGKPWDGVSDANAT